MLDTRSLVRCQGRCTLLLRLERLILPAAFLLSLLVFHPVFAQKTAEGRRGMVSAPTPEAVQAGLEILRSGGNAVDAAAATAFALMVTDPAMCSIGGRSQILIFMEDGRTAGIDEATMAPGMLEGPACTGHGYRTAPVPGSPAALDCMLTQYGTLPLAKVMQPAIRLARDGFTVTAGYEDSFSRYGKVFPHYPGSVIHFMKKDGNDYKEGERFRQPVLAKTLATLADEGSRSVYSGSIGRAIVDDMREHGGLVTERDLEFYSPGKGAVVEGWYRTFRIVSRGDQCDGASVIEMLHILEHFDLKKYRIDDPGFLHLMAQVLYLGNADEYLPDWQQVSTELAQRRVREIDLDRKIPVSIRPSPQVQSDHTNHLSVVDAEGNAVALTQSIGPSFGSKVANPELGFFYAYSYDMNDDPVPYQREKTSQSPTMVLSGDQPVLVLGSAGSSRIPASIVQVIVRMIDFGMSIDAAIAAPRLFLYGDELRMETKGLTPETVKSFKAWGYKVRTYADLDGWFGRVHGVAVDHKTGEQRGGADPRDEGAAKGL